MTKHQIYFKNSNLINELEDESINLVITSPPYPMIEMWDDMFVKQNNNINISLNPNLSFNLMHEILDNVWYECFRVLKKGGFLIINIGDATRNINNDFKLFDNHSRIVSKCVEIGFNELPCIIWKKQCNTPNKFMGSGMYPCGAYVTLEHEYILIFRKGLKRVYTDVEKEIRKQSAYFWHERNIWFSDIWEDVKGVKQSINSDVTRNRSAAFPLELPFRLINMYSIYGDTVLDPFCGLGTTNLASMILNRNSFGYEIDNNFKDIIKNNIENNNINKLNSYLINRIEKQKEFIKEREESNKELKYYNKFLDLKVISKQEECINIKMLKSLNILKEEKQQLLYEVQYE